MDSFGYQFRLAHCFIADQDHYKLRKDLTPDSAAHHRASLAAQVLPSAWLQRARFNADNLPVVYHTYKGQVPGT